MAWQQGTQLLRIKLRTVEQDVAGGNRSEGILTGLVDRLNVEGERGEAKQDEKK